MGELLCHCCANRYSKSASIPFYRLPTDAERKRMWIAAVNRKDWLPSEYSWICGKHFVSGRKSNDLAFPDYVPSVFDHVKSPQKHRLLREMGRYEERRTLKERELIMIVEDLMMLELVLLNPCYSYQKAAMAHNIVNHTLALPHQQQ